MENSHIITVPFPLFSVLNLKVQLSYLKAHLPRHENGRSLLCIFKKPR